MEWIESIRQKQLEIKKIQDELKQRSADIFESSFKKIFEDNPNLESFSWSQYTPYFNDGDTCYFSAHTDYIYVNDELVDDSDWYHSINIKSYGKYNSVTKKFEGRVEEPNPNFDAKMSESVNQIVQILNLFDDDFYLQQFGDHMHVKVTRDGIHTSECDHD